ncbi:hypothetical protein HWV62_2980 [Athelia sp. TMB]|nr:hypothetical protein HWV62_2980 [Athelia sp. TMB]
MLHSPFSQLPHGISFTSDGFIDRKLLESTQSLIRKPITSLFSSFDIPRPRSSPPRTPTIINSSVIARVDYLNRDGEVVANHGTTNKTYGSVAAPKPSIPLLREALSSLDSKMASLMSQREQLESHLARAVRLQSPVQRLPREILSSIFVIGVSEAEDPLMVSTLMLVCRFWADVAVNTAVLWSDIAVTTHDSLEKARRKLERSKSCPLDITVNFGPRQEQEQSGGVKESIIRAMDLISPALWRTRSLRLSVPNRPHVHDALLRCRDDAPLLEFFSIRIFHSVQEDHYSQLSLPLFNGNTPRLQSCSFTSFNFGWDRQLVSNLRILKLGGYWNSFAPSALTLLRILGECPGLEELALRNISEDDLETSHEDLESIDIVQLPRLVKVSFYYAGITRTRALLNHISFPALETLELCYLDEVSPLLDRLKQQSNPLPLRCLRIESSFFNEMKLASLLVRLPSLVSLQFVDCDDVTSNFLKAISMPTVTSTLTCQKLETLSLDGCTSFDWDSLRTFIESRLPGCSSQRLSQELTPTFPISSARRQRLKPAQSWAVQPGSKRLRSISVTRCYQISKEMAQWLRMYVTEVTCEPAKGVWGEPVMP